MARLDMELFVAAQALRGVAWLGVDASDVSRLQNSVPDSP